MSHAQQAYNWRRSDLCNNAHQRQSLISGIAKKVCSALKLHFMSFASSRMNCPHCGHHHTNKIGLSRHKRQRWMCKGCGRTFGAKVQRQIDPKLKAFALQMHAEDICSSQD